VLGAGGRGGGRRGRSGCRGDGGAADESGRGDGDRRDGEGDGRSGAQGRGLSRGRTSRQTIGAA
jgi:hypothetical protein